MSKKRFTIHKESKYKEEWYAYPFSIKEDGEVVLETIPLSIAEKVRDKLNEQEELIEELHASDHMGWERAEHFEKELKQKKIYIKRLEYKVQKFKEMNGDQQKEINNLNQENSNLLGDKIRSLEEFEKCTNKLKAKILQLQEENEQLRFLIDINSVSERRKLERQVDEQQATIRKLQDLCGESDSENARLRLKSKELQKEIKLLKPTNIEQYEQIQKLQKENEQLNERVMVLEKLISDVETSEGMSIDNLIDTEMIGDE